MLRPEYAFRISAFSEDGLPVEPTRKGMKYGSKFDTLKEYSDAAINKAGRRPPYWDIASPPSQFSDSGENIPPPEELFNLSKPGKYTMTIEAACFACRYFPPPPGDNATNYYLVKFPPVKLTVIKERKK